MPTRACMIWCVVLGAVRARARVCVCVCVLYFGAVVDQCRNGLVRTWHVTGDV